MNALRDFFHKSAEDLRQREEIEYLRGRVLQKFPLLGVHMAKMKTVATQVVNIQGISEKDGKKTPVTVRRKIKTAATDGETIYYSPKFFAKLSDDEKVFVYAHEVMHAAFNHILRSGDRDKKLWNRATDAVINQMLISEGLPIVQGGVDIAEAINHSAEEMYEKLLKEKNEKKKEKKEEKNEEEKDKDNTNDQQPEEDDDSNDNDDNDDDENDDNDDDQAGHDDHDIWDEILKRHEWDQEQEEDERKNKETGKGRGQPNPEPESGDPEPDPDDSGQDGPHGHDSKGGQRDFDNFDPAGDGKFEKGFLVKNRAEKAHQADLARKQLAIGKNRAMGEMTGDARSFGDVGKSEAAVDWKKVLKKTLETQQDRWSYRRSNADNGYMARVEEIDDEDKGETEVLLDTSGSVSDEFLREFLRQLKPILKNSKMRVGCFDHRFHPFVEIKNEKDIDNYQIPEKGGTDWDLAVKSFTPKKHINKIVFTDGEKPGKMPDDSTRGMNIIWLVYGDEDFDPVCGRVIRVRQKPIEQNYELVQTVRQTSSER
jgi:predicted metal-dependent peptidase